MVERGGERWWRGGDEGARRGEKEEGGVLPLSHVWKRKDEKYQTPSKKSEKIRSILRGLDEHRVLVLSGGGGGAEGGGGGEGERPPGSWMKAGGGQLRTGSSAKSPEIEQPSSVSSPSSEESVAGPQNNGPPTRASVLDKLLQEEALLAGPQNNGPPSYFGASPPRYKLLQEAATARASVLDKLLQEDVIPPSGSERTVDPGGRGSSDEDRPRPIGIGMMG